MPETRTPITTGESGATVTLVQPVSGPGWIEKTGPATELDRETDILRWCSPRLPVPQILTCGTGFLRMSEVPGVPLTDLPPEQAVALIAQALHRIHAVPTADCPFSAAWDLRLAEAAQRVQAGLVDASDFNEAHHGRSPEDLLSELKAFPPLPLVLAFTHGDLTLENVLAHQGHLSGMIDWSRAGLTHPAQDWALALRSVEDHFGNAAAQRLRTRLPAEAADSALLYRFRLLDELF